jgi:hypothetical protein
MKILRQFAFTFAVVMGLSLAVSAQKNDQKKPPPKERPPVVKPGDKKPPKENPKGGRGDKGKGPGISWIFASNEESEEV